LVLFLWQLPEIYIWVQCCEEEIILGLNKFSLQVVEQHGGLRIFKQKTQIPKTVLHM
jgi:hypothetical protein